MVEVHKMKTWLGDWNKEFQHIQWFITLGAENCCRSLIYRVKLESLGKYRHCKDNICIVSWEKERKEKKKKEKEKCSYPWRKHTCWSTHCLKREELLCSYLCTASAARAALQHPPLYKTCVILLLMLALPDSLLFATKVHFVTCKMSLQPHQRKFSAFMHEVNFLWRAKNQQCVRFVEMDSQHFQKELQNFGGVLHWELARWC